MGKNPIGVIYKIAKELYVVYKYVAPPELIMHVTINFYNYIAPLANLIANNLMAINIALLDAINISLRWSLKKQKSSKI
jgi:uncharacterized membrane-anchored protein